MPEPRRVQLPQITISSRLPQEIAAQQSQLPLLRGLWVESTGYFPNARGHLTERASEGVDFYLLIYCVDGRGWFETNGTRWPLAAGDLAVALPKIAHGYGAAADEPWTIQWTHFNGRDAAGLLQLAGITTAGTVISLDQPLSLFSLFNDMLSTLQAGYSVHHLLVAAACLRHLLSRLAFINTYTPPLTKQGFNIQQMIELMLNNLDKRYTLDELAGLANMTRVSFSRLFRQKTGYSPVDYLLRLKIQKASELLETTELPINKIAETLGYHDPYYFSRLFKQFTNFAPTQYRASIREESRE